MHSHYLWTGLVVLAAGALQGDPAKDLKLMEGAWTARILEADGNPLSDEDNKVKIMLVVRDGRYAAYFDSKLTTYGTIRLDPGKSPKTIDAIPSDGPHKGKIMPGLYQIQGDEMHVIFSNPGKDRPREFKTKEAGQVLINYKRIRN